MSKKFLNAPRATRRDLIENVYKAPRAWGFAGNMQLNLATLAAAIPLRIDIELYCI